MVSEALYTFGSPVDSRFNKKLQSIFSFVPKLSVVHLVLFTKLLRAVSSVWNAFLSTLFATRLLKTLTLARSSCALVSELKNVNKKNREILFISILDNGIYYVGRYFLFSFSGEIIFFFVLIKNSDFVGIASEAGSLIVQRIEHNDIGILFR